MLHQLPRDMSVLSLGFSALAPAQGVWVGPAHFESHDAALADVAT